MFPMVALMPTLNESTATMLNEWTMIVAVYNTTGDTYQLNINGGQQISGATAGVAEDNTNAPVMYIGARADGYYFEGQIADVAIWNSDLSAAQISTLYSDG
jgi:hypothetical protein